MFCWLADNLGTILVTFMLALIVVLIILNMRKGKKKAGPTCCGKCSSCAACEVYRHRWNP